MFFFLPVWRGLLGHPVRLTNNCKVCNWSMWTLGPAEVVRLRRDNVSVCQGGGVGPGRGEGETRPWATGARPGASPGKWQVHHKTTAAINAGQAGVTWTSSRSVTLPPPSCAARHHCQLSRNKHCQRNKNNDGDTTFMTQVTVAARDLAALAS